MKNLIALDIDGTITSELESIDPRVVKTLKQLSDQGWAIALLTGRTFSFAWKVLRYLDFPYFLAVQNGADILEMPSKKILRKCYIDSTVIPEIEKIYQGQKEDFIIYAGIDEGDFCYYRKDRFSKKMLAYLEKLKKLTSTSWVEGEYHFSGKTFPLIKCFGDEHTMHTLASKLQKNPHLTVSVIRDPVDPSLYLNLITHAQANKGKATEFLKKMLYSKITIAAGDDQNDLPMFAMADIKIAMETSPEDVLAQADIIAKKAAQCGIIDALMEAVKLRF